MTRKLDTKNDQPGFYARYGIGIVLLAFLFTPACFYCAAMAVATNVNKIEDWLPKSFRETKELAWFRTIFPTDQFILVSWEGCKLADPNDPNSQDDPRIAKLAALLTPDEHDQSTDAVECRTYFKSVSTGREILDRLTSDQLKIELDEAVHRLQGAVLGPDGRQTCLMVSLTDAATRKLKAVLGRGQYRVFRPSVPPGVLRRLIAQADISDSELHLGGPPVDNISIDEEGERTLMRLAGVSLLLGLFLAWWSLRSIFLTWIVFTCGVLSAATSLGLIWLCGETVDAIVLSMPSLVYVLAISGAVHLINYFRDAVVEGGEFRAAERAAVHAFKPAILCTITTAFGLVSLYASELTPIRKFGLFAAMGVIATLFILFTFLPAALHVFRFSRRYVGGKRNEEIDAFDVLDVNTMTPLGRIWYHWSTFVCRRHVLVATLCMFVVIGSSAGLSYVKTSIDLLELFDSKARILQDYRWLEKNLGMLVPLEIVVKFSEESQNTGARAADASARELFQLTFLERMETTALVQETIERQFGEKGQAIVGRSISAVTFAPALPEVAADQKTFSYRHAFNGQLEKSRQEFIDSGFLRVDPNDGSELWRISLRVAAFQGVDYGQFVHQLDRTVQPIMDAHTRRVQILSELVKSNPDGRYVGAKVFLWDKPTTKTQDAVEAKEIEHHRAMVDALNQLLVKARIRVGQGEADPDTLAITQQQQLNEKYDRVALVGPFSDVQVQTIQWAIPNVIDLHGPFSSSSQASLEANSGTQPWLSAVYTGVVPIVYKAQRVLLSSLVQSTIWSFLTITPLMILVSRSVRAGLVAMLPNILPTVVIFGAMGWMGIAIDIGSMMSASIALGVAVDDTIHFLSWFRGDLERLKDRKQAILCAYQRCATPTLQAALISGLGLSVFAFSTFTPTQRFGWLMLTILIAGVVAELVFLPAILAGPLGKVFESKRFKEKAQDLPMASVRPLRQAS